MVDSLAALGGAWLILPIVGACLVVYAALVLALVVSGRRTDARALAGFVPDCVVFARRLIADPRVPRRHKLMLGGLLAYLASPVDLVPDFIPVAGQLDDALLLGLVLRRTLGSCPLAVLVEHWPGPEVSLDVVLRLAGRPPVGSAAG
jgi:uncharacterized membrane protein YkvA (DUF1232 family)